MKNIQKYIFLCFLSQSAFANNWCESITIFTPAADELDNYSWTHELNENFSTFIYSSSEPNNHAKAEIYFCARVPHHIDVVDDELHRGILGRNEPWFKVNSSLEDNCIHENESLCLSYTVITLKDEQSGIEIPPVQIELKYENEEERTKLFEWVKSLGFTYNPNKSLKHGTAQSAAP